MHQLAAHARLGARVGREVRGSGAGRGRRPHAGVPVRARRRQRPRAVQGDAGRVSDRARPRLRGLARVRQQLLAGRVHRRRGGADPAQPLRRGRLRGVRAGRPDAAARRRPRGRARRPGLRRSRRLRGAGRLEPPGVARDLPRLPAGAELHVGRRRRVRRAVHVRRAGSAGAQPVGAVRRVDGRAGGERAERATRVGSRSASTPATSISSWARRRKARRCRSACSSTASLPAMPTGSTSTRQGNGTLDPAAAPSADPPAGIDQDRTFEITFEAPGAEAYCFTFG